MVESRWPGAQLITSPDDISAIQFVDDMAEIEVPVESLPLLPFKNDVRADEARLGEVARQIRFFGYNNMNPVIVRVGRRGRWVVVDGGHRLTAAQRVAREFWPNLFGRKVRTVHLILFRTPLSDSRIDEPPDENGIAI